MSGMFGQLAQAALGQLMGGGAQQGSASSLQGLLGGLMGGQQGAGGLGQLAEQLRSGGLGPQLDSWIGTGANQPVEPEQLAQALGPDRMQAMAQASGVEAGGLAALLSQVLPALVNQMTPQGELPQSDAELPQGGLDSVMSQLLQGGGNAGGGNPLGALAGLFGGGNRSA